MKPKWICAFCRKALDKGKGQVLSHMKEAHSKEFDIYPNPLVPKDHEFDDYTED